MKKNRKFKKCCSLALAGLIALELSGTALAAESTTTVPTLEEELATLERQLAELENSLRKEQDKTVEQKKEADNKLDKWNIAGDVRETAKLAANGKNVPVSQLIMILMRK